MYRSTLAGSMSCRPGYVHIQLDSHVLSIILPWCCACVSAFTIGTGGVYFLVVLPCCERVCSIRYAVLISLKMSPMSLLNVVLIMTSYPWAVAGLCLEQGCKSCWDAMLDDKTTW